MDHQSMRWEIGQKLPPLIKEEITHTQLVKYAGASGDFNPIHTVVPIAEEADLGGVIAHGMLIMGFAAQAIGSWFPRKNLRRFRVRFAAMTMPGEQITIIGIIKEQLTAGNGPRLRCELIAHNQHGEIKLQGEFEVLREESSR